MFKQLKEDIEFVSPTRKGFEWYKNDKLVQMPSYVKEAWVGAHPEGSDRGGLVVWVEVTDGSLAYFYEPDAEWRQ